MSEPEHYREVSYNRCYNCRNRRLVWFHSFSFHDSDIYRCLLHKFDMTDESVRVHICNDWGAFTMQDAIEERKQLSKMLEQQYSRTGV